jgi:PH domain
MLLLTDDPRLIYVDQKKDETKGQIPWHPDLTPTIKASNKAFEIVTVCTCSLSSRSACLVVLLLFFLFVFFTFTLLDVTPLTSRLWFCVWVGHCVYLV